MEKRHTAKPQNSPYSTLKSEWRKKRDVAYLSYRQFLTFRPELKTWFTQLAMAHQPWPELQKLLTRLAIAMSRQLKAMANLWSTMAMASLWSTMAMARGLPKLAKASLWTTMAMATAMDVAMAMAMAMARQTLI